MAGCWLVAQIFGTTVAHSQGWGPDGPRYPPRAAEPPQVEKPRERRDELAWFGWGLALFAAVRALGLDQRFPREPAVPTSPLPSWRWIGAKNDPEAPCPKIAGFVERQLFELGPRTLPCDASPPADCRRLEQAMRGLDRFCVWERRSKKASLPRPAQIGLSRLDPDAVALSPAVQLADLPGPFGRRSASALAAHFTDQQNGSDRPAPTRQRPAAEARPPQPLVRLAFLDTEPTAIGSIARRGRFEHGHFLRLIGRDLAGSGVEIRSQLALPITEFDAYDPEQSKRDWDHGGTVGSFVDLAEAIHREVADWIRHGDGQRLVLNLSVGWDGQRYGGLAERKVEDLPAGPAAVYAALDVAATAGALVFAAAGNAQSGPLATDGFLLPAAWARGPLPGGTASAPLLYAVGGVQWNGTRITNARRHGMPDFSAYADHVVAIDPATGPTAAYTGTSVATATVSAIAARIWSQTQNHDRTAAEIAGHLRSSGAVLWYDADLAQTADLADRRVREISLCGALERNCPPRSRPHLEIAEPKPTAPRFVPFAAGARACGAGDYRTEARRRWRDDSACPSALHKDFWADAWVIPQPEFDPCPNCSMGPPPRTLKPSDGEGGMVLYVEISDAWRKDAAGEKEPSTLESGTLEIVEPGSDPTTTTKTSFVFKPPAAGESLALKLPIGPFGPDQSVSANVSWLVTQGGKTFAINSPVLIFD